MNKAIYLEVAEMFYRNLWMDCKTYEYICNRLNSTKTLASTKPKDIENFLYGIITDVDIRVNVEPILGRSKPMLSITVSNIDLKDNHYTRLGLVRGHSVSKNETLVLEFPYHCDTEELALEIKMALKYYEIGVISDE